MDEGKGQLKQSPGRACEPKLPRTWAKCLVYLALRVEAKLGETACEPMIRIPTQAWELSGLHLISSRYAEPQSEQERRHHKEAAAHRIVENLSGYRGSSSEVLHLKCKEARRHSHFGPWCTGYQRSSSSLHNLSRSPPVSENARAQALQHQPPNAGSE